MSETILRIGLGELKTIRLKIGATTTEMALNESEMMMFAREQSITGKISKEAEDILDGLVRYILLAVDLKSVKIEFVLPVVDKG
jgi:hypothetical protein